MESSLKTYRNHLTTLLRITKDEYYKTHFQENKKDLKTVWKTIKVIINVKTKNDVPINSLLNLLQIILILFLQVLLLN